MNHDNHGRAPLFILVVILAIATIGFGGIAFWQSRFAAKESGELKTKLGLAESLKSDLEKKLAELESEKATKEKEVEEAKKAAEEKSKEAAAAKLALLAAPEEWASSTIKTLGLSFRYPKEWGTAKITAGKGETGERVIVYFSKMAEVELRSYSTDFTLGTELSEEFLAPRAAAADCDALKKHVPDAKTGWQPFEKIEDCESLDRDNKKVFIFRFPKPPENEMSIGERVSGLFYTGDMKYPFVFAYALKESGVSSETIKKLMYSIK
jgi:predicted transcriptional regulator